MNKTIALALGSALVGLLGCSTAPILGCQAVGAARPICGFQNPEDLVTIPGDAAILVSEFGAMDGHRPGVLSVLELASEARRVVFRGGDADGTTAIWGDPQCPGPPSAAFSPHGIHLGRRPDGALQLLVVQHGGRESIEFFEVTNEGAQTAVAWRGCVLGPDKATLNSVAALPEGGFVTTEIFERGTGMFGMMSAFMFGGSTGSVHEWTPQQGYRVVPNTEELLPNGIEVSADGQRLFLNTSGSGRLCRLDRDGGNKTCTKIAALDNARWAPDGRLLVAALLGSVFDFNGCEGLERGSCAMEFQILAVDPETLEHEVLYHGTGAPMGAGTIGLQVGRELFIGSFAGDRILRVPLE